MSNSVEPAISSSSTVPATPQSPNIELPSSSPSALSSSPKFISASSVNSSTQLVPHGPASSKQIIPAINNTLSQALTKPLADHNRDVIQHPSSSPVTPTINASIQDSSSQNISSISKTPQSSANTQTTKRLHSTLTPDRPLECSVSSDRRALVLHPDRHSSLAKDTPEAKRYHRQEERSENTHTRDETALYSDISYAIGNNPIPTFGLDDAMIPFGMHIDSQVYVLHNNLDGANFVPHAVASALLANSIDKYIPKTITQAQKSSDSQKWEEACNKEIAALKKTKTFRLVERPKDRKVIPSKWVFTIKDSGLYKARIVVQGFRQVEGIDYQATFAPVIRYDSVRVFLALSAKFGLKVHQMDVVTAFLNSSIDTDIYVKPPPGFDTKPGFVWKLRSALYGLKQSPMLWNNHIKGTLSKLGFEQNKKEFGLYFRRNKGRLCLIALYVDDLLIASSSSSEIQQIKNFLKKQYEMKDLGPVNKFLGMNIKQTPDQISISLVDYINTKAKEYNFTDIRPTHSPLQRHIDYYSESPILSNKTIYQSLIGTLIFMANTVRPDIAHAVHFLSRFLQNPTELQYKAARRVFDYVYTTREQVITYKMENQDSIVAYSDASYADCPDRKSTYGYICMYSSGPITWCSKRIACMVTSSAEAEVVAASEVAKEIKWLNQVLNIMGIKSKFHILHIDNTSALKLADHPIHHSDTKHIDVRNLFVREATEQKTYFP